MATDLPAVVVEYFDLMDTGNKPAAIELFEADAHVRDDGHDYFGRDEIIGWLSGAASEFTIMSTRLSSAVSNSEVSVVNRIEGDFPGGQVDLRYVFSLDPAGRISALTIAP